MKEEWILKKPNALDRLGERIFIEAPLYETEERYRALYVNDDLFAWYFNDCNTDFNHMAEVIEAHFSTTLDIGKSNGKKIGSAYVDKQADPLKLSLSGNLGSGRAFYQSDIFNIKGEKTPLATSKRESHSNGVLELEKAIFETIASNSLYGDVNIKLSPILAILDINEPCRVYWKEKLCKRAKVIRLDMDGSLDRITHIFQAKKPLDRDALMEIARQIGLLEGEKFVHRIEHGAWSAGNISEHAHMIDFDTVCAVRYWAPQFSFTKWFIDNYFGHEYLGQLKILKSLAASKTINTDRIKYAELKKELLQAREEHIQNHFIQLMGFEKSNGFHDAELVELAQWFIQLSARCYPVPDALELKYVESLFCAPFNFSRFFRFYPILRRSGHWSPHLGLAYLIDCVKPVPDLDNIGIDEEDEDEVLFSRTTFKKLDRYFIHSDQELFDLAYECLAFIKRYDELYDLLLADNPAVEGAVETRAYLVNQDRRHLFMPYSIAGPIDDERDSLAYEHINKVIATAILANKRGLREKRDGLYISNVNLFKEGYFATLHNNLCQHKLSLNLYKGLASRSQSARFEITVNGKKYPCDVGEDKNVISISSPFFDNLNLMENGYTKLVFYKNGKKISLNKFIFSFTRDDEIFNFAPCLNAADPLL